MFSTSPSTQTAAHLCHFAAFKCVIAFRAIATHIQRAALNHGLSCPSLLCVSVFFALVLTVCLSVSLLYPRLCVRTSLAVPVSVRPSSISGQPTSAPTTPTAVGSAAYVSLLPTSLTVHSFVSLHQYCCPSTDQTLQQEHR